MRSTSYDDIVEGVAQRFGVPPEQLQKTDAEPLKRFFNEAFREIWTRTWWIDNTVIARKYFAQKYAAVSTYVAGSVVYHWPTGKYYIALRETTGNVPTDTAYWAEAKEIYSAAPYDPNTQYAVGDQVAYADRHFAVHTVPPIGTAPENAAYWGLLLPFVRIIPWDCSTYVNPKTLQDPAAVAECKNIKIWNTVSEMRADTEHADDCYGILIGYAEKGDLAPTRQYSFFAARTDADNDREIIKPDDVLNDQPGRWIQVL